MYLEKQAIPPPALCGHEPMRRDFHRLSASVMHACNTDVHENPFAVKCERLRKLCPLGRMCGLLEEASEDVANHQ